MAKKQNIEYPHRVVSQVAPIYFRFVEKLYPRKSYNYNIFTVTVTITKILQLDFLWGLWNHEIAS